MSDAQRTMTGAEHCVYCGDFFECRDHVIPVRYNNVKRDYRSGSTVHCCNRCNGLLGSAAYFTVRERALYLIDRYRRANHSDLTFPDWDEEELESMAPKMRQAIRGRLSKRRLIRLKIDNLERVCLGLEVEPIDPLFVNGRHIVGDGVEVERDGWGRPAPSEIAKRRVSAEAVRQRRAEHLKRLVSGNHEQGVLYWRFRRGPLTVSVVDLPAFREKHGLTETQAVAPIERRRGSSGGAVGCGRWQCIEVVPSGEATLPEALLIIQRMIAKGAISEPGSYQMNEDANS